MSHFYSISLDFSLSHTSVNKLLQVFTKILQQEFEMRYFALPKVFNHIIMGNICI